MPVQNDASCNSFMQKAWVVISIYCLSLACSVDTVIVGVILANGLQMCRRRILGLWNNPSGYSAVLLRQAQGDCHRHERPH